MISGQAFVKRSPQALLRDYLQFELYHSIGSYAVARDRLAALEEEMRQARGTLAPGSGTLDGDKLLHVTRLAREYNAKLASFRHLASRNVDSVDLGPRHPIPDTLPLTLVERFKIENDTPAVIDARRNPWASPVAWAWAVNFYEAAIVAIEISTDDRSVKGQDTERIGELALTFATSVVWPRDGPGGGPRPQKQKEMERRMRSRKQRFDHRCREAFKDLPGVERSQPLRSDDPAEFLHRICTDNLSTGLGSVPLFVISALAEAHLSMHAVEGWQSMPFGAHAQHATDKVPSKETSARGVWLEKELNRCIALNTFVYCAARTAPWIFAENEQEREIAFDDFSHAWDHAVPTRCMWISAQVGLLALHRRAYCYALKGQRKHSYNDYYKLQRHVRETRRRVEQAPIHISGAPQFLTALNARAHQNVGELYRSEHAHRPARKHYGMAIESLKGLGGEDRDEMTQVMIGSRWHVQLQLSQGKASYEMGQHKDSLRWHLLAWRAFLILLADETGTEASTEPIDQATAWLDEIKLEPELRKNEVHGKLRGVVDQLDRLRVPEQLGALAADVLLRLGHVLFVLNLDPDSAAQAAWVGEIKACANTGIVETLSFSCLKKAAECDPHNTLAASDVLKSYFRTARTLADATGRPERVSAILKKELGLPKMARIADQWPRGGDDYERIDRVAEYLMLRALDTSSACGAGGSGDDAENLKIATDLLLSFFMHTDSIEVRKAQAHHFLMKPENSSTPPGIDGGPAIEFVCMRRYSSAFPLLPRPSAFRAHGGGYFLRLHPPRPEGDVPSQRADASKGEETLVAESFGIVVDPGPDFVENLYRTGFSLTDIDMIIVTHDHVDHLNSLESVLSLLHYRSDLLRHQKEAASGSPQPDSDAGASDGVGENAPTPLVYGNESVCKRYQDVTVLNPDKKRFRDIEELDSGGWRPTSGLYGDFHLTSMSSQVDGDAHIDLSGQPSYGICCKHSDSELGRDLSVAITSDTPAPPSRQDAGRYRNWLEKWKDALEADILVSHLSTVPPAELRQLAQIDARLVIEQDDIEALIERCKAVCQCAEEVEKPLQDVRDEQVSSGGDDAPEESDGDEASRLLDSVGAVKKATRKLRKSAKNLKECAGSGELTPLAEAIEKVEERATTLDGLVVRLRSDAVHMRYRRALADLLDGLTNEAQRLSMEARDLPRDAARLERISQQLQGADPTLRGRIEFAMWLRSRKPGPLADLTGLVPAKQDDPKDHWRPPRDHPYVRGELEWARAYREKREEMARGKDRFGRPKHGVARGLFVLGELSEELGTARAKMAERINETLFHHGASRKKGVYALTSDVGLRVAVVSAQKRPEPAPDLEEERPRSQGNPSNEPARDTDRCGEKVGRARILCTTCDLDNDRTPDERYHDPREVYEVCVKGENEGIFYNCRYHNPVKQPEPLFLEQLERFDLFGR